ncbi:hypothetical protein [Allostreptomyces psammosilenae]|uniref:Uncharacterized protein n=1 Tax=Allostreptomyces psammosilenae TaxID=1892865 RepID=A0A852ZTL0_9ACTN|nr:hypothetical protein [Allostreptomyces psammosilenae]NYI04114.1 hypothetical protein [Allostreptomyces psammosilenae]
MDDALLRRVERAAGVPDLVEVLADRLSPSDLHSLLLAVHRRRAAATTPARVLERYAGGRLFRPSPVAPALFAAFDRLALPVLDDAGFTGLDLSPVTPLGTVAAVATVDQNRVLAADRGGEVVADSTNTLALECALRRRARLREDRGDAGTVRLFALHRLVRAQPVPEGWRPHFRMLALTTAGRDTGSFRFETQALRGQLEVLLRLLREAGRQGFALGRLRVALTELDRVPREVELRERVMEPLAERFPEVELAFDDQRVVGRGYYRRVCFHVHAVTPDGTDIAVADGGFTDWTGRLLGNAKERLLVGGLGVELLCQLFRAEPASADGSRLTADG